MQTMILAAGLGKRMRPLTNHTPKPLLEVHGIPLIVWHLKKLAHYGFKEVIINIAHLGYKIPEVLGDGSKWGLSVVYSDEQEEGGLESAGGIVKALPYLSKSDPFFVINGDVWTDYNFDPNRILEDDILAHLILVPNPKHNPKGDFTLLDGKVYDSRQYTFSGIGYYSPKLFKGVPYGKSALAPLLRTAMLEGKVSGELYMGEWYDIGTPERLKMLNTHFCTNN
ncbi:MAG: nucleotidyltransferase family protein [Sulfurovum sp.]|nr:nucleotidyltransferase family protein [Sulfurovum sp.]MCB4745379.1 nucleotidyltransferase family protein [Sulfurovum sp.]MCB4747202.1 nucleotidyltransferase family protein [Sulfurovum sp.]MCB4750598.1 nucleotidyltransferase family protein [Sulfurovum sp.]MCB4752043.1 nucleotidyltransferase family protein [Sulfurovum sp.]